MSEFQINKNTSNTEIIKYECYTFNGNHDYVNNQGYPQKNYTTTSEKDETVLALTKSDSNGTHYLVRRDVVSHLLINPNGLYEIMRNKKYKMRGKGSNTYLAKCSKECFRMYLEFLKTSNESYLRQAERV